MQSWLYFWGGILCEEDNVVDELSKDLNISCSSARESLKTFLKGFSVKAGSSVIHWQISRFKGGFHVDILPEPFKYIGVLKRIKRNIEINSRVLKRWGERGNDMFR